MRRKRGQRWTAAGGSRATGRDSHKGHQKVRSVGAALSWWSGLTAYWLLYCIGVARRSRCSGGPVGAKPPAGPLHCSRISELFQFFRYFWQMMPDVNKHRSLGWVASAALVPGRILVRSSRG